MVTDLEGVKMFYHVVARQCPEPPCHLAFCSILAPQLLALSPRQQRFCSLWYPHLGPGMLGDTGEAMQPGSGAKGYKNSILWAVLGRW